MPIDPYIYLRGYQGPVDTQHIFDRAQLLRDQRRRAAINDQLGQQQLQEGNLRLADLMKLQDQRTALDSAARGAITTPPPQTMQQPTINVGGAQLPGGQSTVQGPPQFDQNKFVGAYRQIDPLGAMNYEQGIAKQQADQQHQQLIDAKTLSEIDNNKLEHSLKVMNATNQILGGIRMAPPQDRARAYAHGIGGLIHAGVLPPDHPTQYPGDAALEQEYNSGLTVEQQLQKEKDARDFTYKQQQDSAQLAMQKRGQDITLRGQNMVDARQRELNQKTFGTGAEPLTPEQQDLVDQIGQGKMPLTRLDYMATRNPGLLAAVSARYPDFDGSKVKSYVDAMKDFTSGKTAVMINSGATALGHLKELKELNTAASHIPHTPAWTAYQNKATTVATELAKFYGDATIPAIAAIKETLTSTLPGNRDAAIATQAQSMGDKFDSFEQQWKNAAPSSKYQAEMPGMSAKAKAARAALDPNYKATPSADSYWNQFPEHN